MAGLWPVSPVQWPAVSTTVGEISVPEHRKRPDSVVNRMTPTLVCTVSRWPSVVAAAGCVGITAPATNNRPTDNRAVGPIRDRLIVLLHKPNDHCSIVSPQRLVQ